MPVTHWMAATVITLMPWTVSAQDEAQPASLAAPAAYQSAFAGYRPLQDIGEPAPENWRSINDEAGRVGGHVGHTKEAAPLPQPPLRQGRESRPAGEHMQHQH